MRRELNIVKECDDETETNITNSPLKKQQEHL